MTLGNSVDFAGVPYIVIDSTERDVTSGRSASTRLQLHARGFDPRTGDLIIYRGRTETIIDSVLMHDRGATAVWELVTGAAS